MHLEITAWPPLSHVLVYGLTVLAAAVLVMAGLIWRLHARLSMLERALRSNRGGEPPGFAEPDRPHGAGDFGYSPRVLAVS